MTTALPPTGAIGRKPLPAAGPILKKPLPQVGPAQGKSPPLTSPALKKPAHTGGTVQNKPVQSAGPAIKKPAPQASPILNKPVQSAPIQKQSSKTATPVRKLPVPAPNMAIRKELAPSSARGRLLGLLPKTLQEICQKKTYLLEYLNRFPVARFGVPEYYSEPNKKMADLPKKNLIYPVSDDAFVHIFSIPEEARNSYTAIEPSTGMQVDGFMEEIERKLVDLTDKFSNVETEEARKKLLLSLVDKICVDMAKGKGNSSIFSFLLKKSHEASKKLNPTPRELQTIKYLSYRDKIGMGVLDPMIKDKYIEDISCSGLGNVFVEHKIFGSLKSSIVFSQHDELDQFVIQLSERIKKPVTLRNPIVDAVLPDGSRINIVYGKEISKRGSNFSIRKFSETPLSILELIEFKSINYAMAAYLSLVIEEGMNLFVAGETASGKTTLLNAITTFVPSNFKVISIEDTPELQIPHKNWLREVSKMSSKGETGADVGMFDLLKAALRQRPNLIVIGEIRGEEGNIAFQAMQTGHQAMATFHASSVEKLIQRLTGSPINVPKSYIDNLNVAVIQNQVRLPSGKLARRCQSISEIVGYDSINNSFSFIEIFRWDPTTDTFEFTGNRNSFLLEEKISLRRGIPPSKKWLIYDDLERRRKILEKIHKGGGITGFYELLEVLAQAKKEGIF